MHPSLQVNKPNSAKGQSNLFFIMLSLLYLSHKLQLWYHAILSEVYILTYVITDNDS